MIPDFLTSGEFTAPQSEFLGTWTAARDDADGPTLIPLDRQTLRGLPTTRAARLKPRFQGLHAYAGSFRIISLRRSSSAASATHHLRVQSHWQSDIRRQCPRLSPA